MTLTTDQRENGAAPSPSLLQPGRPFLVFSVLTLLATAFVAFALPHDREVGTLFEFLAKLLPFVLAVEALARLDLDWARRVKAPLILIPVTFLVYFGWFVPRNFYFGGVSTEETAFDSMYYNILLLTPFLILALTMAYRLGGGSPAIVRRLGYGMLLIMISGIEDLAFLTVNDLEGTPFHPIPEVWTWPSHMRVRLGHWPTKYEAYVFITVHLLAAGLVLFLPGRLLTGWWPGGAADGGEDWPSGPTPPATQPDPVDVRS